MAKRTVNMSQAVRDYLTEHPDAGTKEISEALAKQQMSVSDATIYNVKSSMKTPARRKPGRPKSTANDEMSISTLLGAKKLAEQLGGVKSARQAINVLAKLG